MDTLKRPPQHGLSPSDLNTSAANHAAIAKMLAEKEENKKLKLAELGGGEIHEHNMLAASWVNDITYGQKEFDHRKIFYMNESLLIEENIRKHFDPRNDRKFHAYG